MQRLALIVDQYEESKREFSSSNWNQDQLSSGFNYDQKTMIYKILCEYGIPYTFTAGA